MRLPEGSRKHEPLDPEVEAELAVIEAALAGGPVPDGEDELARLARELRDERAEPTDAFAARLDRWAASGFARAERPTRGPRLESGGRRERFGGIVPRWAVAPAGGLAMLAVIVGIAVSTSGPQLGGGDDDEGASIGGGGTGIQPAPATQEDAGAPQAAPEVSGNVEEALRDADGRRADRSSFQYSGDTAEDRKIVRTADLTLVSEPEEVREVSDGVNEVTNRYEGIVVSSSVQSGDGETSRASSQFQLRIPAGNLQPALADLSELAHVQSRTESTEDITGQFLSAQERIEELEAEREGLLTRLADAETDEAAEVIRRQVDAVNSQLRATRAELENDRQRVRLVPVTVSILPEEGAGDDGDWGVEEAAEDAADVLTTAAGVMLVAGAVLLPLAALALLVALVLRTRTNRARDRALDE